MWSRVVEVMLGCWLLMAPFLFQHPAERHGWWINDFSAGSVVILFGLISYWKPTRHAHLLTIIAGGWLIGFAFSQAERLAAPALQSDAIVGLLLLMFAIIPNHASRPPVSWFSERGLGVGD